MFGELSFFLWPHAHSLIPDKSTAREKHSSIVCVRKEFCFWIRQKYHTLSNPTLFSLASSVEHVGGWSTFPWFFQSSFFRWSQQKKISISARNYRVDRHFICQKHPEVHRKIEKSVRNRGSAKILWFLWLLPSWTIPAAPMSLDLDRPAWAIPLGSGKKFRSWKSRRIELHF